MTHFPTVAAVLTHETTLSICILTSSSQPFLFTLTFPLTALCQAEMTHETLLSKQFQRLLIYTTVKKSYQLDEIVRFQSKKHTTQ